MRRERKGFVSYAEKRKLLTAQTVTNVIFGKKDMIKQSMTGGVNIGEKKVYVIFAALREWRDKKYVKSITKY